MPAMLDETRTTPNHGPGLGGSLDGTLPWGLAAEKLFCYLQIATVFCGASLGAVWGAMPLNGHGGTFTEKMALVRGSEVFAWEEG